jgi:hypothetical protein
MSCQPDEYIARPVFRAASGATAPDAPRATREYTLYLNSELVKREAAKLVPSGNQAVPIWIGAS